MIETGARPGPANGRMTRAAVLDAGTTGRVRFSGDGGRIDVYVYTDDGDLLSYDPETGDRLRRVALGRAPEGHTVVTDADDRAAFTTSDDGTRPEP